MMKSRWNTISPSLYPWERAALDFIRAGLPDHEPYRAWANFEFQAADGAIYEADLLVLTKQGLRLVEIKSRPGRVEGDAGTWTWTDREGRRLSVDNPVLLANRKAKALSSLPKPKMAAQPQAKPQPVAQVASAPIEQYTPPPQQHAAAVLPVQIDAKKNDSLAASGLYLQVGAFANPDAAELLKAKLSETVTAPVFISSVVRNQQILHRVRLGPIGTQGEAQQVQDSVRLANLGQPTLVKPD